MPNFRILHHPHFWKFPCVHYFKNDDPEKLKPEVQTLCQSGVGSLLFLLKHSQPELSNPIRELSLRTTAL